MYQSQIKHNTAPDFVTDFIDGNMERNRRQCADLAAAGWGIIVIWECETRDPG